MIEFCKWIESIGLCCSFHKIEDISTFAKNKTNISWGFLRHLSINTSNLNNVNPKIIRLKSAYLNIGLSFKSIYKEVIYPKNESIYLDITILSIEELMKLMGLRIFNQNIGFMLMENKHDFCVKMEILKETILDYYSDKNLEEIRTVFFKKMVSENCLLPIVATNLYEKKILILISNQKLKNSIDGFPNSYDRVQVPFSLKASDLAYFYKW